MSFNDVSYILYLVYYVSLPHLTTKHMYAIQLNLVCFYHVRKQSTPESTKKFKGRQPDHQIS